jgi:hypothetical protein
MIQTINRQELPSGSIHQTPSKGHIQINEIAIEFVVSQVLQLFAVQSEPLHAQQTVRAASRSLVYGHCHGKLQFETSLPSQLNEWMGALLHQNQTYD